jgi:hypothetical protein
MDGLLDKKFSHSIKIFHRERLRQDIEDLSAIAFPRLAPHRSPSQIPSIRTLSPGHF